ncbi:MAG: accessory gene regulator AgrB [Clostridiaceae bacterium BRH_c20a]|nr:MAG: accessory gene regulator AgrB [Clostridiaceae bacterium BRH_c20a]
MDYLKISKYLSNYITKELDYDDDKKEVITYSIEFMFLQLLGFIVILIFGFVFNAVTTTVSAAIFGAILRKFSGGAHFDSRTKCLFFGAVIYTFIGVVSERIYNYAFLNDKTIIILLFICIIIVFKLAPVDSLAKPIHSKEFKKKLKYISIIFIFITIFLVYNINSIAVKTSITLGIVYQVLTLLPMFNKKEVEL